VTAARGLARARRLAIAASLSAVALVALPAAASAQGVPDASCPFPGNTSALVTDPGGRYAQTFTAQRSGVVAAAQFEVMEGSQTGDFRLDIATVAAGTPTNNVLDSAPVDDPPAGTSVQTGFFQNQAAQVTAGQQFALVVSRPSAPSFQIRAHAPDTCPGEFFFSSSQNGSYTPVGGGNTVDMVFAVFLAPPDTTSPSATITKGPKDKTRKRTATFEFAGSDVATASNRRLAGFQCKLDAAAFIPCTSPFTVSVKKGKHTFQVQAIDEAGNVSTPATDTWKRKKKRKKKK
jgi:hypothetical protein